MKECFICNNEADKKGSHIVPHFLMKRIDNEEGSNERDKELGFEITDDGSKGYFGKAILPEKIEELYGEVTDELIANNKIGGIVDFYFCTNCEKKLSVVESEYSKVLNLENEKNGNYLSFDNGFLAFLFWISILYRLSIQEESDLKLKIKEEKRLKRILFKYLKLNKKEIKADLKDLDLFEISYKVVRSVEYSPSRGTFLTNIPNFNQPYSLMIDEFLIFIYFKKSHLNTMIQDFYGSQVFKEKAEINNPFKQEESFGVDHTEFKNIVDRFIARGSKLKLYKINLKLDMVYERIMRKRLKMPDKIRKEILDRLVNDDEKLGIKDTTEYQMEIIKEVLEKYHT